MRDSAMFYQIYSNIVYKTMHLMNPEKRKVDKIPFLTSSRGDNIKFTEINIEQMLQLMLQ